MTEARCFHCEDRIPDGIDIFAEVAGVRQPMCCHGCRAAATFIAAAGLKQFYQYRSPLVDADLKPNQEDYAAFDNADVRRQFVALDNDGTAEVTLYIGDLYCPACIWLVEQVLLDGEAVVHVGANPASRRVTVRWQHDALSLGDLLKRIATVGFKPEPVAAGQTNSAERQDYRGAIKRLVVASVFGMQAMMFSIGLYAGEFQDITTQSSNLLRIAGLLVTLPVVGYAAAPFFRAALISLRHRRPSMDVPVSLAIGIALLASLYNTATQAGAVYFDSIAMFVLLLCLSRFLEMRARHRADGHAEALATMLPVAVHRLGNDNNSELVALGALRASDRLQVSAGDVLAADGQVIDGTLSTDESMMTGESTAQRRQAGDRVLAGSKVRAGSATVEVINIGAETQLAQIARLTEKAQQDRSQVQQLSDRFASAFVVVVLCLAALVGVIWWQLAPERMLPIVLSVLIVACPCALAIATPTALATAAGLLTRHRLLLVRARLIDCMRRNATIVFDKTGTLTSGKPVIHSISLFDACNHDKTACLEIAAALEAESTHALAHAFSGYATDARALDDAPLVRIGAGIGGVIAGQHYRIGKQDFVAALSQTPIDNHSPVEDTVVYLGNETGMLARFAISDALREDALTVTRWLRRQGFEISIASGDNRAAVGHVAAMLGIDDYRCNFTPEDKLRYVQSLKRQSRTVIMVGDGVNDAPVMAMADAAIAIANGTAMARSSADGLILGQRLEPLVALVQTAARTRRVIRQSLIWAAAYNLIAVGLAAFGWVAPWMAAIGMSASSLLVVANALRIGRKLPELAPAAAPATTLTENALA